MQNSFQDSYFSSQTPIDQRKQPLFLPIIDPSAMHQDRTQNTEQANEPSKNFLPESPSMFHKRSQISKISDNNFHFYKDATLRGEEAAKYFNSQYRLQKADASVCNVSALRLGQYENLNSEEMSSF